MYKGGAHLQIDMYNRIQLQNAHAKLSIPVQWMIWQPMLLDRLRLIDFKLPLCMQLLRGEHELSISVTEQFAVAGQGIVTHEVCRPRENFNIRP